MKIKSGFELRSICGENIIVAFGTENIDFSKVIALNESAACIWNALVGRDSFTTDDMVQALTAEYEVSEDVARHDCEKTVKEWSEAGLVEL